MSMVKIFIEAESLNVPESKFLDSILRHIGITHDKYELMPTGGYKKLMDSTGTSNVELLRANTDAGGKNLVVFDADTTDNNGGFQKRRKELLARRDEIGLDFDLFLWPDNNRDGDVEVLMEDIARKDLYFTSLPISQTKRDKAGRGAWLWDDANIWNLDAEVMKPIKDFLFNNIK